MNKLKSFKCVLRPFVFIVVILSTLMLLTSCKAIKGGNKGLLEDTYVILRYEKQEGNEYGFIMIVDKLEYVTVEKASLNLRRNKEDNNNPYRAYVYHRYFDEETNSFKDKLIGRFEHYKLTYNIAFKLDYVIRANEVPNKFPLTKGRVLN